MQQSKHDNQEIELKSFVTFQLCNHHFGVPILDVHDVFMLNSLTQIPLAPKEIAGVLNLRGRVVTAINLAHILHMDITNNTQTANMAIGVEHFGEVYGVLVDSFGEVITIDTNSIEPNPTNLDQRITRYTRGVHRMDNQLLMLLDLYHVLNISADGLAA